MSEIPSRLVVALGDRYRIVQELGAGGMATVYLADDLKHDRKVAIKVLRPELAAVIGGERFVAEIKTTAALQHPHILPLFDSGEADTFLYYVMPYVEGESLRDRLDRDKQLPVDEAVRIAKAVGSALHYAHERGIVHRDIKPANILLHAGEPVVADFGIAIAISAAGGGRLTETGMSVGTPHYMSPEQASADRDVDARSDTYALACVLYEMLAGAPPHTGPSAQAVLMRILTENPRSITEVRRSVPTHVRDALSKGLEKLPADRFASAKGFVDALGDPSFQYQPVVVDATVQALPVVRREPAKRPAVQTWLPLVALLLGITAGAVVFGDDGGDALPPGPAARFEVGLTEDLTLELPEIIHISPDGRWLAFVGDRDPVDGIFIREIDDLEFRVLPGTELAVFMDFSPDGQSIVYSHGDGSLHLISVSGGSSREIASAGDERRVFLRWSDDGFIRFYAFSGGDGWLAQVPESGGEAAVLAGTGGEFAIYPRSLPDTDVILYVAPDLQEVQLVDPATDSTWTLIPNAMGAELLPTGEMIYVDGEGGLWAAPFDTGSLGFSADPVPILNGVVISGATAPAFSVSRNGTLVYTRGPTGSTGLTVDHRLMVVGFDGGRAEVPIAQRRYRNVRWSPSGDAIAFAALEPGDRAGETSLYTYNLALRTATERITREGLQAFPVWSPDGQRVAFLDADRPLGANPQGFGGIEGGDLAILDLATGEVTRAEAAAGQDVPYVWTNTGEIVYAGGPDIASSDLLIARPDQGELRETYLNVDGDLGAATVSPDGRWAAFRTSREVGEGVEIVVRSFPEPGPPIPVSNGWGDRPRWSADGSAIYYWKSQSPLDSLMRARVRTEPEFRVLSNELVLTGNFELTGTWDLHPAGDRFIIAVPAADVALEEGVEPEPIRHLAVVNWFTELRAALGDGR
jgi:serine/threonine-protein kinase